MPASPQSKYRRELRRAEKHLSAISPALRQWIAQYGPCELEIAWERDLYEALVRAVAHQQLHGRAAATILSRLQTGFPGGTFPTPRQLVRARIDKLRGFGFSNAKALAILGVARAALSGQIPTREQAAALDTPALVERLVALRGIGPWTVEMLLIFTLGRLDIMPVDDYGVRVGLRELLGLKDLPKKKDFELHTATWSPYRSVAAWYLWRRAEARNKK